MTAPALVNASDVREYMINVGATGNWDASQLGSNVRSATWTLERATGRYFADRTATLRFTTNGEAFVALPGLRSASSVALQGSTLTADESYYLIPDSQQTGVYTGIQFRSFRTGTSGYGWWKANPEWFDRNLDSPYFNRGSGWTSLPNDLVIGDTWGYAAGNVPEPALFAVKVLAAFYALRPHALLSGTSATPDGNFFDLSGFPIEVQAFVREWRVGPMAALV